MTNKSRNIKKEIKESNKSGCFIRANTYLGPRGYFENILESYYIEKIYIVKNRCGSYMLNYILDEIKESKYFPECEYFISPDDLNRIDCLLIKELNTVIIAENPGIYNILAKYPLIVENIIDFGDFFDENYLLERKEELISLRNKKNDCNILGYKFLNAANEICENIIRLSHKYIDFDKINLSVRRLSSKYINEKHLKENIKKPDRYRFIDYISAAGQGETDIYESGAEKIFYITNENDLVWHYTKYIEKQFSHLCRTVCSDSLNPERIKAVYLEDFKILFIIKERKDNRIYDEKYNFINMERFSSPDFKKENKQKLKFMKKCRNSLIEEAVKYFKEAEHINKSIENIYISSVNAVKSAEKNKYTEAVIKKILP